jgi:hypothetical protein
MVLSLCDRFGVLPSQVRAEDVSVLRMLELAAMGKTEEPGK